MNAWVITLDKNNHFIEENVPYKAGWIECKLGWYDDHDRILIERVWYTPEEGFRADKHTDISYNWDILAWRELGDKS